MKARTILVGNRKGGIGKSLTTMLLATTMVKDHGKKVLIIECDSQRSITKQRSRDEAFYKDINPPYPIIYSSLRNLEEVIKDQISKHELIFIDMPRITSDDNEEQEQNEILKLLILSESILMPVGGHELELDSSDDFLELIHELKEFRKQNNLAFNCYAFHNRARGISEDNFVGTWAESRGVKLFDTVVKESVHLERNLSTYYSLKESQDKHSANAVKNYLAFVDEFRKKYSV